MKKNINIITFEFYIKFLLNKIIKNYNLNYYPAIDLYELSNKWYKLVNSSNIEKHEIKEFIEVLYIFNSENFIKDQELFLDTILYLESMDNLVNNNFIIFGIYKVDIENLNLNEYFLNKNLLKYSNECKIYYNEYHKIDNFCNSLDKFLI